MFDFDPGEELQQIADTARNFATNELAPRLRQHESNRAIDPAVRETFAGMGLERLELPEGSNGIGLGAVARALVNEELGAGDAGAALALDRLGPALYTLIELGGEQAIADFAVPLLEQPSRRAALIHHSDATLECTETVSGRCSWTPTDRADLIVILHQEEALVVREGFGLQPLRGGGLRAAGASEVRFEHAPVAARWTDPAGARRALARTHLYVASLLLGVLRQAAVFSRAYALEREAFGRVIAHHQGLAFLIADMHSAVDATRALVHEAAWQIESGFDATAAAAAAYAEAIEASRLVGPNGVQILGGHGFMQDHPVEKYMRESRLLGLLYGGIDAAREGAASIFDDPIDTLCLSRGDFA